MAKKPKTVAPLATRVKTDPALLKRALADPGLRSKLPGSVLSPAQRAVRQGNQIAVPGGTLTNNQIGQQAQQAADLQYGPNAVKNQQQKNDQVAGWYRAYQAELAQHQANSFAAGQAAVGQIAGLQQGIQGLGQADAADQRARAGQVAALTGGQVADTSQTDSNAAAVRQALLSGQGSTQAGVNAASNRYADTLTHVVAPGQALQAFLQGQQAKSDLQGKINATKASTTTGLLNSERQGVAAQQLQQMKDDAALQSLGIKTSTDLAKTKLTTSTSRANAKTAAKTARTNAATSAALTARGQDLSHEDRQAAIAARGSGAGKGTLPGGAKVATPQQQGSFQSNVKTAETWVQRLRSQGISPSQIGAILTTGQAASAGKPVYDKNGKKVLNPDGTQKTSGTSSSVPKIDPLAVGIAMDLQLDERGKHISAGHVKQAHSRGIKVNAIGATKGPKGRKVRPKSKGSTLSGGLGGSVTGSAGTG